MFSLLVGRPEAKSKLTGLSSHQEASQKELEGVRKMALRRTSPRRSGGSESAVKIRSTSPGPTLKKDLNERGSIFNCLLLIEVFRVLSKHTTYITRRIITVYVMIRYESTVLIILDLQISFESDTQHYNVLLVFM
jgi:hypothetical protein